MEYPKNEKWPEKTGILLKIYLSSGATLLTTASSSALISSTLQVTVIEKLCLSY
jgi:hypothetical protein